MSADATPPESPPLRVRRWLLAVALAVWAWTTYAHGLGTDLAREYFTWSQQAGSLGSEGGMTGFASAERLLAAVFLALVAAALGVTAWRMRGRSRAELSGRLVPWAVWGVATYLIWKTLIVYASELVHFAQYGLITALLSLALGRGRRPRLAFLVAVFLGALDEAWQHWGIALSIEGNLRHGFDWSDLILNSAGACGGALLVLPLAAAGDDEPPRETWFPRAVAVLAAALLPLLLLDRVTLARLFGTYTYNPFWNELENGKPVHWMTPVDGIPLFVAAVLFLGLLLGGRRAMVSPGAALALLLLVTLSIQPPSRLRGRPVHEVVSRTQAARVADGSIVVDGLLDEAAWAGAARVGPFVHSISGEPSMPLPDGGRADLAPTHARLLWDSAALYVAFEVDDPDVWARATRRDDPTLPGDEVVEVFVDPDGDEIGYYEFEFSPLGVQYDLFNLIPESPQDHNPSSPFLGLADWDARDVRCAVSVDGTLDRVDDWQPGAADAPDRGWTVEIAIPWSVFRTTTTPQDSTVVRLPPEPGQRWRFGLYRVERPRVDPSGAPLADRRSARPFQQLQAWSPTHMDSFHRPERFGVVEFVDER